MSLIKCHECKHEISDKAEKCPNCGVKPKKKTSTLEIIITLAGVWAAFAIFGPKNNDSKKEQAQIPSEKTIKEEVRNNLYFDFEWSKGGFDTIMVMDITINNKSTRDIKDLKIICDSAGPSGTVIDKNERDIFEYIKKGSTKKINEFNMGFIHSQAKSTKCSIKDFAIAD